MRAALIGEGIAGSLTPSMHEAEAEAQGFAYHYARFDTALEPFDGLTLPQLLELAESEGFAGVNVTHPFKTDVANLLDDLSDTAGALGAVNTVIFEDGRRIGHNTDYMGFLNAFNSGLGDAQRERVLLCGAGGAGSAVALALVDADVRHLMIADPQLERAEALRAKLSMMRPDVMIVATKVPTAPDVEGVDGVVNATPLGMRGHPGMAINPAFLSPSSWVAEIVYFPLQTEFLTAARCRGCRTMTGAGMAVHQAAAAFALITGKRADPVRMGASFERLLASDTLKSEVV